MGQVGADVMAPRGGAPLAIGTHELDVLPLDGVLQVAPVGIASTLVFGNVGGDVTISPAGIASTAALGQPALVGAIDASIDFTATPRVQRTDVGTSHTQYTTDSTYTTDGTLVATAQAALAAAGLALHNQHISNGFGTLNPWPDPNAAAKSVTAATAAASAVLTISSHGYSVGDVLEVAGATGAWSGLNGSWSITATTTNTVTINFNSTGLGSLTGTVTAYRSYLFGVMDGRVSMFRSALGGEGVVLTACGAPDWMTAWGHNADGSHLTGTTFGDLGLIPPMETTTHRTKAAGGEAANGAWSYFQEYAKLTGDHVARYNGGLKDGSPKVTLVQVWNEMKGWFVDSDGFYSAQPTAADRVSKGSSSFSALIGPYTITSVTNASPPVVTVSATHALVAGDVVKLAGTGKTSLDNHKFVVASPGSTTFTLQTADGQNPAAPGAGVSAGTVTVPNTRPCPNYVALKAAIVAGGDTWKGAFDMVGYTNLYNAVASRVRSQDASVKLAGPYYVPERHPRRITSVSGSTFTVDMTGANVLGLAVGDTVKVKFSSTSALNDTTWTVASLGSTGVFTVTGSPPAATDGWVYMTPLSKRDLALIDYFLAHASPAPDVLCFDWSVVEFSAPDPLDADNQRQELAFATVGFRDICAGIRNRSGYAGQPIGFSELYVDVALSKGDRLAYAPHDFQAAGMSSIIARIIEGNSDPTLATLTPSTDGFALQWQPSGIATNTVSVTGVTHSGNTVTVTTSATHFISAGETVIISGVAGITNVNGTWTCVSAPTATTFTFTATSTPTGTYTSGGSVQSERTFHGDQESLVASIQDSEATFMAAAGFPRGTAFSLRDKLGLFAREFPAGTRIWPATVVDSTSGAVSDVLVLAKRNKCIVINQRPSAISFQPRSAPIVNVPAWGVELQSIVEVWGQAVV